MAKTAGNMEQVVYIGSRHAVGKEWNRKRYVFKQETPLYVPEAFARDLVATLDFCYARDVGRTVDEIFPAGGRLVFRRWGALGDLVMFRAATSAFLRGRKGYEIAIKCVDRFAEIFQADPLWEHVWTGEGRRPAGVYDSAFSFDQTAEQDHRGVHIHRAILFLERMTKQPARILQEDWIIPCPPSTEAWVDRWIADRRLDADNRVRPVIAVQVRGSGPMKSLPPAVVKRMIGRLAATADVILIEPIASIAKEYISSPNVHDFCHRDVLHTVELLRHVDLAVVMDSGPLWLAHAAPCPTLAILGPTRPEQRIALHPLYPHQCKAVCLNDLITCPPCFEAAQACSGRYSCMQGQPDWDKVLEAIMAGVASTLDGGSISLPVLSAT